MMSDSTPKNPGRLWITEIIRRYPDSLLSKSLVENETYWLREVAKERQRRRNKIADLEAFIDELADEGRGLTACCRCHDYQACTICHIERRLREWREEREDELESRI